MHDIDRTQLEYDQELAGYGTGPFEITEEQADYGFQEAESPFGENEELDLASELLTIADESELDNFLGKLIGRAGRAVGRFVRSPVGRALGGILKNAARQALPVLGQAAGAVLGGPAGAAIGERLASAAGQAVGLEVEGLSQEDAQFEGARRFVRLAGAAVARASGAPPAAPPVAAARQALVQAAQRHAPGFVSAIGPGVAAGVAGRMSGRWYRRGGQIVLVGV